MRQLYIVYHVFLTDRHLQTVGKPWNGQQAYLFWQCVTTPSLPGPRNVFPDVITVSSSEHVPVHTHLRKGTADATSGQYWYPTIAFPPIRLLILSSSSLRVTNLLLGDLVPVPQRVHDR